MSDNRTPIQAGSKVSLFFSLALEDGTVADSTEEDEPLQLTMGDGTLIEGLEYALYGLRAGDRQCISIDPREAFGYPEPGQIHVLQLQDFPDEIEPGPGLVVEFSTDDEDEILGTILAVDGDRVTVDFNHPLAGHSLTFDVEIVEVSAPLLS